jgi:hypothetical protein
MWTLADAPFSTERAGNPTKRRSSTSKWRRRHGSGSARLGLGGDDELLLEASEGFSVVTNGSQMDFQGKNSQALVLSW